MLSTTYDAEADALYIGLRRDAVAVARTRSIDDWTMVDEDATGAAVGIEVIHPARVWPLGQILDEYKITGPTRKLLEELFPPPNRTGRRAFPAPDVDLGSAAERVCLAL